MLSFTTDHFLRGKLIWQNLLSASIIQKQFILLMITLLLLTPCLATPIKHAKKKFVQHVHSESSKKTPNLRKQTKNPPVSNLKTQLNKPLVEFVHNMVTNIRYSSYKLGGTHFDFTRGIYILDCSNYVDLILKKVHPRAYSKLVNWSRSEKPSTYHYYHFFNQLSGGSQHYWNSIEDVKKLQAGDIIVFRKKRNLGHDSTGHIMIVMEKPVHSKNMFLLRIADSAPFRHSHDTRLPRVSGIGIGTILLKVNPKTSQLSAYAWSLNSRWKKNVVFAMARPMDLHS